MLLKIVLISTYEMGRQPFGLASPAAWLRAAGAQVHCVDLAVESALCRLVVPERGDRRGAWFGAERPLPRAPGAGGHGHPARSAAAGDPGAWRRRGRPAAFRATWLRGGDRRAPARPTVSSLGHQPLGATKHYYFGDDELEKLLRRGEGWLAAHPERELITGRYLKRKRLVRAALDQLMAEDAPAEDDAEAARWRRPAIGCGSTGCRQPGRSA